MKKNKCQMISIINLIWKSKLLMAMRVTFFAVIISISNVFAINTYSQSTRLSLDMKNTSIKSILGQIEDQSKFYFIYDATVVDVERKISIDTKNELITDILDEIFKGHDVVYKINDRQIALTAANSGYVIQQLKSVSGKVTDISKLPLPGVTVVIKGTAKGTVTDASGEYSLTDVPENAILQFSFVGLKTQEIQVAGKATIDVTMTEETIGIEEVVAIGYGTVKKIDLTGAVGSVSADELRETPITRLEEGLQGKIAGVMIQNTDGTPGSGSKVRIRGSSSINFSNDPLYVVDGFIGADIATINPKDIATVDILKDASATAIYGSRGANGVVIITTNIPEEGDIKINVDASYGVVNIAKYFELSDFAQSLEWVNEYSIATGGTAMLTDSDIQTLLAQGATDWQREVTQAGSQTDINVSLTGGGEKFQYFVSGNFYDEVGTMLNSEFNRYSLRSNITSQLTKNIKMAFNTFGTVQERNGVGRLTSGQFSPLGKAFMWMPRIYPAYDADGNTTNVDLQNNYGVFNSAGRANPIDVLLINAKNFSNSIQSNLDLTIDITDFLSLTVSNSGKYRVNFSASQNNISPPEIYRNDVSITQTNNHLSTLMNYDVLTFHKEYGNHSIKADAIYEFSKSTIHSNSITVSQLSTLGTGYHDLGVGSPSSVSSGYSEVKWRSYMGRINYAFKDKYLLTASIRADGSSKFQKENRWGYFPSAALAWRLSEEDFLQNIGTISNLKVRIGYGEVGNASLPAYSTLQVLTTSWANYDYYEHTTTTTETGVVPGALVDRNIKWEVSKQFNAGLDWALFNGRLSGVFDYYNKKVDDLIFQMSIPTINGTSTYLTNIGSIRNTGLEFSMDGILVDKNDFSLNANFNISFNQSEVLDLGAVDRMYLASSHMGLFMNMNDAFVANVGEPLGQLWGYKYLGLWQVGEEEKAALYRGAVPGNTRYEDLNEDGKYGNEDKQVIANTTPTTNIGFGLNFRYKNIDLAVNGYGAFGFEIYNANRYYVNVWDDPKMDNRWTAENPTDIPIWNTYSPSLGASINSRNVEKGDFIKLANITVGYTFDKNILNKFGLSDLRIYASAINLLTFTNYSGLDPEASVTPLDSDAIGGIDNFGYPTVRTFSFGINLNF